MVTVDARRARVRPGRSAEPQVTIALDLADFARLVGGDLDPMRAVMDGRMRIGGDFQVAARLGEMFGQPSAV